MRSLAWALFVGATLASTPAREPQRTIKVSTVEELKAALRGSPRNIALQLTPGTYPLSPESTDVESAHCGDNTGIFSSTFGLKLSGEHLSLIGMTGEVTLTSDAEHDIYFKDCTDCLIEGITVRVVRADRILTGGGILVHNSDVTVRNCAIDNSVSSEPNYGISVRDNSHASIEFNEIRHSTNSIVLLDDARATIGNNFIESDSTNLPGAGLLLACRADAVVERNHIRGGTFGITLGDAASLDFKHNILENVRHDGISANNAGLGHVSISENAFFDCGASAISIRTDGDQTATRNLVVQSGTVMPPRSAIAVYGAKADAAVQKNTLYDNTVTDEKLDRDVSREAFWRVRRPWTRTYRNTPVGVDGRHRFYESAFLTRYGRWAD